MNPRNTVRIIAGKWRGRKINFPNFPGIRPTPDRVRETLFNWLQTVIQDASCLDLFAGSGALGFEALSRGAAEVVFVDQEQTVINHLNNVISKLEINNASVIQSTIPSNINLKNKQFNIVFLDPPFNTNLIDDSVQWLEDNNLMQENGLIYIESDSRLKELMVPETWELLKEKTAGEVTYRLLKFHLHTV